jgi:trk system potassium uptake protein TrkA
MFVLIVGSGRLGIGLAKAMASRRDDVVIVDNGLDSGRVGEGFDGIIVDGDPMDMDVLEEAGVRNAALFMAVTGDDNVNIFCAQAATMLFGVKTVLARIADPDKEAFYRGLGLKTVCPTVTGINQVLEIILEDRFSPVTASLDPSLACVHPLDAWVGKPFSKIQAPSQIRIVGVLKGGHLARFAGHDIVRREDTVVVAREKEKGGRLWIA